MDGSSLYTQKRMVATTAHTQMALRMLGDGKGNAIQMTENLAMDIIAYQFSQGLGDETIFSNYVAGNYDSSGDYWRLMDDGTLVNDGSGWLRDENGKYINIDGTLSDEPIPGQTLGATGIETGLLNILEGTSSQGYNTFSDEQVLAAQKLTQYRLSQLEDKVNKHNNLIERTFKLEGRMDEVEHDIKDLKAYHKPV